MAKPAFSVACSSTRRLALVAVLVVPPLLAACSPADVAVDVGVRTGIAIAQERSVEDAARDGIIDAAIGEALFQAHIDELFRPVNIDVMEGRVLLTGMVVSQQRADEAAELAWRVDGVKRVINEVRPGAVSMLDLARDRWISTRLRARLLGDGTVSDLNYVIRTVGGVIHILGIAQNDAERDRVGAHAREISYVRGVVMHVVRKDDPVRLDDPP